jgi:hypothetical protein
MVHLSLAAMACGPFVLESFRILSEGMTSVSLHRRDVRMFGAGRQVEPGVLLLFGCCRRPGSSVL